MTDYIRARDLRTKRQRLDDQWSWFCHAWRQIAWWHGHPWETFRRLWGRIYWAELRRRKLGPFAED